MNRTALRLPALRALRLLPSVLARGAAVAAALVVASCSSTTPTPVGTADSGPVDLTTPITKLRADVMPLFNNSCGFTSCHGNVSSSKGNLFLGAKPSNGADAAMVHKQLVGVRGDEISSMPFVTAGDPALSFLMHKMDGDQATLTGCTPAGCQATMPQGDTPLPAEKRDIVRRWIAQGAQDN